MNKRSIYSYLRHSIFLFAAVLCFLAQGKAQNISIETRVDSTRLLLGDEVTMKVLVEVPKTVKFQWPAFRDSIGKLEILGKTRIDTLSKPEDPQQRFRQTYYISSYDSGSYTIPPLRLVYRKANDTTNYATESGAIVIDVYSPKVDTTAAIREIKGPMDVPFSFMEILPYIIIGWLLIVIGVFLYFYIKRRKTGKPLFVPAAPVKAPHELAMEELMRVQEEKLWQQGYTKQYYTRITDTLRIYIESRYHIPTMEQTSDEILHNLTSTSLPAEEQHHLSRLLKIADMVKFAKAQPLPAEHEFCLNYAIDFVKHTTPVPEKAQEVQNQNSTAQSAS